MIRVATWQYATRWFPVAAWTELALTRNDVDPNSRLDRAVVKFPNGTLSVVHGSTGTELGYGFFDMSGSGIVCPD